SPREGIMPESVFSVNAGGWPAQLRWSTRLAYFAGVNGWVGCIAPEALAGAPCDVLCDRVLGICGVESLGRIKLGIKLLKLNDFFCGVNDGSGATAFLVSSSLKTGRCPVAEPMESLPGCWAGRFDKTANISATAIPKQYRCMILLRPNFGFLS